MTFLLRSQSNPLRLPKSLRLLALWIACVCLWMGTAGTVGHTDMLRAGGSISAQAALHHATAAAAADLCAACQWAQGALSQSLSVFAYAAPLCALSLLLVLISASPSLSNSHRRSPRAPPLRFSE